MKDVAIQRSLGLQLTSEFLIFSISGPQDEVRQVARDAIYGLNIIGRIQGDIKHFSEEIKMKDPQQQTFLPGEAQIDISIDIHAMDRLILMFRYLKQAGFPIENENSFIPIGSFTDKMFEWKIVDKEGNIRQESSNLTGYLNAIIEEAKQNADTITINPYPRPYNRNFWLNAELAAESEAIKNKINENKINFFSSSNDKVKQITNRMKNIIELVKVMIQNHPRNQSNISDDTATIYLKKFILVKNECKDESEMFELYKFMFIRDDDRKKFILLGNKYLELQNKLEQEEKNNISEKKPIYSAYKQTQ